MFLSSLGKFQDAALLLVRLAIGIFFIFIHGWPKLLGGPEKWEKIGAAMGNLGVTFAPEFWGLMAALTESLGAALFAIGFLFRPSSLLLAFVMGVAATMHLKAGDSLSDASHAIEMGIVFLGFVFIGPGKYSFDR
jgi:putative oxidoreductase